MADQKSTEAENIAAQGEADAKRLEARAKLSPVAQVIYSINDTMCENIKSLMKVGFFNLMFGIIVLTFVIKLIIDTF